MCVGYPGTAPSDIMLGSNRGELSLETSVGWRVVPVGQLLERLDQLHGVKGGKRGEPSATQVRTAADREHAPHDAPWLLAAFSGLKDHYVGARKARTREPSPHSHRPLAVWEAGWRYFFLLLKIRLVMIRIAHQTRKPAYYYFRGMTHRPAASFSGKNRS